MRKGTCKHYNRHVAEHGECEADINVRRAVGGPDSGWLMRTPCFVDHEQKAFMCERYAEPTDEELAARNAEIAASIKRIGIARKAILDAGAKPSGTIKCPHCAGTLHWSKASNGHIHAKCSTAKCVSWME